MARVIQGAGTQEEKERIIAEARKGLREEKLTRAFNKIDQTGRKIGRIRKDFKLPKGLNRDLANKFTKTLQPRSASSSSVRKTGRRGRPKDTFKVRALPDGSIVKVPTAVFNKMRSTQRAQMRLEKELRMARMSAMAPPDHVRGMGPSAEDAWLMGEDFQAQQGMPQEMMMQEEMQQGPAMSPLDRIRASLARRRAMGGAGAGGAGMLGATNLLGPGQQQFREDPNRPPMSAGMGHSGGLNFWGNGGLGGRSSILNQPTIFNRPGQTEISP